MKNRYLGFVFAAVFGIAIFLNQSASAAPHYRVHGTYNFNGIRYGYPIGSGLFWAPNWPVYFAPPIFGASYWPYFNYDDYYSKYGAIAYSKETGKWGVSFQHTSRKAAQEDAVGYCGEEDCQTVTWVQGGCAVIAKSDTNGAVAYGVARTLFDARNEAMRWCRSTKVKDCKPLAGTCAN